MGQRTDCRASCAIATRALCGRASSAQPAEAYDTGLRIQTRPSGDRKVRSEGWRIRQRKDETASGAIGRSACEYTGRAGGYVFDEWAVRSHRVWRCDYCTEL